MIKFYSIATELQEPDQFDVKLYYNVGRWESEKSILDKFMCEK
jgi:hypothetical protein